MENFHTGTSLFNNILFYAYYAFTKRKAKIFPLNYGIDIDLLISKPFNIIHI